MLIQLGYFIFSLYFHECSQDQWHVENVWSTGQIRGVDTAKQQVPGACWNSTFAREQPIQRMV